MPELATIAAMESSYPSVSAFRGINNVTDPVRLPLGWLEQADNVVITDTGAIEKRQGYAKASPGSLTGAYATEDFSRLYLVDAGELKAAAGGGASVSLLSGLSAAPMHFTEINDQVFFSNGVDRGIVMPDNEVMAWDWPVPEPPALASATGNLPSGLYRACCTFILPDGRETGAGPAAEIELAEGSVLQLSSIPQVVGLRTHLYVAPAGSTEFQSAGIQTGQAFVWNDSPDALGADLLTADLHPLPDGADVIQAWRGRIYAAQYFPEANQSAIWFSQPMGFHLFDVAADFFLVPGRALMLAPHGEALLIGTDADVHAYDGERLAHLAPYGVPPGQHFAQDEDDGRTYFWSHRGLCAALPFANLTERQVSVAHGSRAGGAIVRSGGQKRYLACLQSGGLPFNQRPPTQ